MRPRILFTLGGLGLALLVSATLIVSVSAPASAASTTDVSSGGDHSCALVAGGAVQCWGDNDNGQLGNNTTIDSAVPVDVCRFSIFFFTCSPVSGMTDIAAGRNHTCAVTSTGGIQCWGDNSSGQLGNNDDPNDRDTPVDVCATTPFLGTPCSSDLADVVQVAVGDYHSCALLTSGIVKCWGENSPNGQLGNGFTTDRATPVTVCIAAGIFGCTTSLTDVVAIAAGGDHTCAVTSTGGVECWGDNDNGQLGNNDDPNDSDIAVTVCATTPFLGTPCSSDLAGVVAIGAGLNHTCAVTSTGGVKCWGDNGQGQLGNGFTTDRDTPVSVCVATVIFSCLPALGDVADISDVGDGHSCVLTTATGVKCWGDNAKGQLGSNNAPTDSALPVDACTFSIFPFSCVPTTGFIAVSPGDDHTCGATVSGGVKCWGENSPNGQVGDGTTADRASPRDVSTLGPKSTPTPTSTATSPPTPTDTATPTSVATATHTPTPPAAATATHTPTPPAAATATHTPTPPAAATATPTSPAPVTPTNTPPLDKEVGDVNSDGQVNAIDAALILQFSAGLIASVPNPASADVNGDGMVNAIDAALILQFGAGLITSPL